MTDEEYFIDSSYCAHLDVSIEWCAACVGEVTDKAVAKARAEERERADEAERLLRLTCSIIVDGVEDESLEEMRSRQSPELADISLAIQTACNRMMREIEIKAAAIRAQD